MTATLRTQRARSRQAQSGAKRVEVVLDAGQLADLQQIKDATQRQTLFPTPLAPHWWLWRGTPH